MRSFIVKQVLVFCIFMPLFAAAQMTAVEYNDKIVNEQNKIGNILLKFTSGIEVSDYDNARIRLDEMKKQAQEAIRVVEELGPWSDTPELWQASLDLFRFYLNTFNNEYTEILDIVSNPEASAEDYERINTLVSSVTEREIPIDRAFQSAQTKFAEVNGFELVENELQQEIDQE